MTKKAIELVMCEFVMVFSRDLLSIAMYIYELCVTIFTLIIIIHIGHSSSITFPFVLKMFVSTTILYYG